MQSGELLCPIIQFKDIFIGYKNVMLKHIVFGSSVKFPGLTRDKGGIVGNKFYFIEKILLKIVDKICKKCLQTF